jgi:D-glycero-alpha-D-manno-heptose 1-phosphate guanylyltransferase
MRIIVLAGGFGTRLQSVVSGVPKALAPIGQVPFLYLQIEHWIAQGLRSYVFLLHYQADLIIRFLEDEKNGLLKYCQVSYVVEPSPMDTGGAVAYAVKQLKLEESFLLTNADTWLGTGINEMANSSESSMAVVWLSDASRYGQVQFNEMFKITSFSEKCSVHAPGWINAGLCKLSTDLFKNWDGQPFSLERHTFPKLVAEGLLKAVPIQNDFIDIGIPGDYFNFCRWIEKERKDKLCF